MVSPELVRRYPFFAGLEYDQLVALAQVAKETTAEPGHYFFNEGDVLKSFYLVVEGTVAVVIGVTDRNVEHKFVEQLYGDLKKKDVVVSTVEGGDLFGWSALIPPYISTAGAKAVKPSRIVEFNCEELWKLYPGNNHFTFLLTQKVAQVMRQRLHDAYIEILGAKAE
jgi:CRP/FNR family cyclic AMP-dependent transcriptional regulator